MSVMAGRLTGLWRLQPCRCQVSPAREMARRVPRGLQKEERTVGVAGYLFLVFPATTFCLGVWQYNRRNWKIQKIYQEANCQGRVVTMILRRFWGRTLQVGTFINRPLPLHKAWIQYQAVHHVNWGDVYPKSCYKIMDPVSVALSQNLRCFFVATLVS